MKERSNNLNDYTDAALLNPPSPYLKKEDLQLSGPCALTITRIEPARDVESERGTKKMAVFFFRETDKGMVLNVTNNGRMVECYDRDPRKWIGKKIVVKSGFNMKKAGVAIDVAATLRLPAGGRQQARQIDDEQALADAALAAEQAATNDPGAEG